MSNETKMLFNAKQNRSAITSRYNDVVKNYSFSNIFSMIQRGFDKITTNDDSNMGVRISKGRLTRIFEQDGIPDKYHDMVLNRLIKILKEDYGYIALIENDDPNGLANDYFIVRIPQVY